MNAKQRKQQRRQHDLLLQGRAADATNRAAQKRMEELTALVARSARLLVNEQALVAATEKAAAEVARQNTALKRELGQQDDALRKLDQERATVKTLREALDQADGLNVKLVQEVDELPKVRKRLQARNTRLQEVQVQLSKLRKERAEA